jgi:DNA-binding SARP family transcriptional activator
LYDAPLLDATRFDASDQCQDWLISTRENAHARAMQNPDRLTALAVSQCRWDDAIAHGHALNRLDPTNETATRHLLRVHGARNDVAAIDACWRRLQEVLRREFQAAPTAETAALYQRQRTHAVANPAEGFEDERTTVRP